ncbi:hypothetical protein [Pedobacter antarcticus]|uniref:hypothetical protein n=1 Tax=Pedobacter antarcticus TaxID=34086 RepID=UPI000945AD41|nr:hypothetical protein [Pedobacter antarcticus]
MISSFPPKKLYNPGGLLGFKFIPFNQVVSYPEIVDSVINKQLALTYGSSWLTGYSTAQTLNFDEECIQTENGPTYLQTISGYVPGDRPELIALLQALEGIEMVVQVMDPRGQNRLVGSHGYPLVFKAVYKSGTNRPDARGFSYTISNTSIFRAPVYKT